MFDYIKGTVQFIGPEFIVVENSGIGYQIISANPFVYTKEFGQVVQIYTYHYVREDVMSLYGFKTREEKMLFTRLLNVSGIGPKGALAILATGNPKQVVQAIETEDESFLVKFPGVGKKTARQMILDLKGKLSDLVPDAIPNLFAQDDASGKVESDTRELEEALLALKALGYSDREVGKVTPELKKESLTTDQYIKKALSKLLR